jgi:hypothetical protein
VVSGGGDLSTPTGSARAVARRLAGSPQLSRRELELLPLYGPGSVYARSAAGTFPDTRRNASAPREKVSSATPSGASTLKISGAR